MESTTNTSPLVARLRAARLRRGLSQEEAADAVGYAREHLNRFENGHRWSAELAYRLSLLLGVRVTLAELFPEAGP